MAELEERVSRTRMEIMAELEESEFTHTNYFLSMWIILIKFLFVSV